MLASGSLALRSLKPIIARPTITQWPMAAFLTATHPHNRSTTTFDIAAVLSQHDTRLRPLFTDRPSLLASPPERTGAPEAIPDTGNMGRMTLSPSQVSESGLFDSTTNNLSSVHMGFHTQERMWQSRQWIRHQRKRA